MNARKKLNRRTFLKYTSASSTAAALTMFNNSSAFADEPKGEITYRTLGRTGLKVAVVGIGALKITEPAIFQAAFERGVNYVDTARVYLNGNSEKIVGKALKGYRDKVYVATKFKLGTREHMLSQFEESLRCLEIDYVDVIQVHNLKSKEEALNPIAKEVIAELKKQGKTRFAGVTTHANEIEVIEAVLSDPDKFYDVILVKYNFQSPKELREIIKQAASQNIGIVAMKTQNGGFTGSDWKDLSPHQAALKWVLQDESIALAVPGMNDLAEVMEDTAVMRNLTLTPQEQALLERYRRFLEARHCRLCGKCNSTCKLGVDILEINRCLMYAERYKDFALAKQTFQEIPPQQSTALCKNCDQCTAMCVYGLKIAERLRRLEEILT